MKPIRIDGISQDPTQYGIKVTLVSGKDKYSFFDKKRDGSFTKAMEQFKKYGFLIGQTVQAEVKEEQKQFVNKDGKTVNYTQRTIIYFQEVEELPVFSVVPEGVDLIPVPEFDEPGKEMTAVEHLKAALRILEG